MPARDPAIGSALAAYALRFLGGVTRHVRAFHEYERLVAEIRLAVPGFEMPKDASVVWLERVRSFVFCWGRLPRDNSELIFHEASLLRRFRHAR